MQIAVFEGYGMPRGRGGKRGHTMRRRGKHRGKFAAAARACARSGHKPGTHGFGSCMRAKLKGR